MCRTSGWCAWAAEVVGLILAAAITFCSPAAAQDAAAAKKPPEPAPSTLDPHQPSRQKAPGEPVRLAVLTVAVHTPVFIQAYDRFRAEHGEGKLVLDLWVEQEWAESPRPLDFDRYDMILALRCSIPGLETAVPAAAAKGAWIVSDSDRKYRDCAVSLDELPDLAPYYRQRGVTNMVGFLEKVCERFQVPGVTRATPLSFPPKGSTIPTPTVCFPTRQATGHGTRPARASRPTRRRLASSSTTPCTSMRKPTTSRNWCGAWKRPAPIPCWDSGFSRSKVPTNPSPPSVSSLPAWTCWSRRAFA